MKETLPELMENLGFLTLKNEDEHLFMLEAPYYFLVVESVMKGNYRTYNFIKYFYNRKKEETKMVKCYFEGLSKNAMLKRVGSYIVFMLEKGYLKTNDKTILLFAKEMSERKTFV